MLSDSGQQTRVTRVQPGVDGWLLLLCLVLVFVSPATAIYSVWHAFAKLTAASSTSRILLLTVYCVTFLGIAICSVWAGLELWLVRPNADKFARKYLLGYLTANVAYFVVWFVVVRPTDTLSLAEMGWFHVAGPIGPTALWYFYLENSTRVRETYSGEV